MPLYCPNKPSPTQLAFLAAQELEVFYGGAASGGKTEALLMGALQYVDQPRYAAMIFRRSYTDLALPGAIMDRARMWLQPHIDAKQIRYDRETHTFHFPSGAKLAFGFMATPEDKWRYQSSELQYIGFDEVTDFPDPDAYEFMFTRLRRLKDSDIPLRVRCASNPIGRGAHWVKQRFVDDPGPDRLFIPAFFTDNPHIDQQAYRKSLGRVHPALQKALIEGDWTAVHGAAFPEFDPEEHVVRVMAAPQGDEWKKWEGMDWGTTNPTAWLAAALDPEGNVLVHGEYYEPGLISRHASAILALRDNHWGQPLMAVCDPSIKQRTGFGSSGMGETVHSEFAKSGIYLVPANNDRRAGRVRISELLRKDPSHFYPAWHPKSGEFGAPRLYFTENCRNIIEQLQFAPIDEVEGETVDPYWESRRGHAMASLRYLLTARIYPGRTESTELPIEGRRTFTQRSGWRDWVSVG